jgi:hypothetical protein
VLVAASPQPTEPEGSGSGPWTWLAAGLGLLVIVASGILLFLLFSGIGETTPTPSPSPSPTVQVVAMPDFIGEPEANAAQTADAIGLELEVEYVERAEEEADRVIEQLPEPGTEIAVGTSVQVTVSTEVETVVVPPIGGIREAKAIEQIEAAGLRAGIRFSAENTLPEGYVIETDPRAGASVQRGALIDYVVSTGPANAGTPRPTRFPTPARTPMVTPNRTRVPTRSPAPTPFPSQKLVLVGDYRCLALGEVRLQLQEKGLLVGAIIPDPAPDDGWIVHGQLPQWGASAPVGSAVDLVLMDSNEPCPPG